MRFGVRNVYELIRNYFSTRREDCVTGYGDLEFWRQGAEMHYAGRVPSLQARCALGLDALRESSGKGNSRSEAVYF